MLTFSKRENCLLRRVEWRARVHGEKTKLEIFGHHAGKICHMRGK